MILGTIKALDGAKGVRVRIDGEERNSTKKYSYLASYVPAVNDRVLIEEINGSYVILGKLCTKYTNCGIVREAASATTAAECTGNAATATSAAECTGNAATATKADSATIAESCSGNAASATTATECTGNAATASAIRHGSSISGYLVNRVTRSYDSNIGYYVSDISLSYSGNFLTAGW